MQEMQFLHFAKIQYSLKYMSIFLQYANAIIYRFNSFPCFLPYIKMERILKFNYIRYRFYRITSIESFKTLL